jgi:hypothetical protein
MNLDMKKTIKKETVKKIYYSEVVDKLKFVNKEINHLEVKIVKYQLILV